VKSVLCLIKQHEYASYKSADIIHMRAARDDSSPYITHLLQSPMLKELWSRTDCGMARAKPAEPVTPSS
jgi:hypothetical protein